MTTTLSIHVYLISEAQYVAAGSEEQAREFVMRPESEFHEYATADEFEIEAADTHGFYEDETPRHHEADRTMLEQAGNRIAAGESIPFTVGWSHDVF